MRIITITTIILMATSMNSESRGDRFVTGPDNADRLQTGPHLGKVYLTGAGPGAPDLLTLRAARVLSEANIVLHDSLINKEILSWCPADCEIIAVGKRCGVPDNDRQERIHQLLEDASRKHRVVVRLKGGDPCVFGRGGEELEFLIARGIPWEVIPGISAGVGALSQLGLPLTHRKIASSVTLLTGSQAESGNFAGLSSPGQTLVFYMGLQHVPSIAEDLMRRGMDRSTYALCASKLTYPDQRVLAARLDRIGAEVTNAGLEAPAMLVVGEVVRFWKDLTVAHKIEMGVRDGPVAVTDGPEVC